MIADARPGLDPRRLARLIAAAIDRCELELSGFAVLTEAANGGYVKRGSSRYGGKRCLRSRGWNGIRIG